MSQSYSELRRLELLCQEVNPGRHIKRTNNSEKINIHEMLNISSIPYLPGDEDFVHITFTSYNPDLIYEPTNI